MAEHKSLAEALAAFQAELPKLTKDERANPHGGGKKWSYAGLDQVCETVEPVLGKHGLSIIANTMIDGGDFVLSVSLLHESGQRETGFWPLPDPRKVGPQDLGSAMTYGRRYLTLALTGTFPGGEDDDGQKAQTSAREHWDESRPRNASQNKPVSAPPAPKTSWTDEEVRDFIAKLTQLGLAQAAQMYDWMAGKDLHNRPVVMGYGGDLPVTATEVYADRLADQAMDQHATVEDVSIIRDYAEARGLLKVQVSDTETLDQTLNEARELAAFAADAVAAAEAAKHDAPGSSESDL